MELSLEDGTWVRRQKRIALVGLLPLHSATLRRTTLPFPDEAEASLQLNTRQVRVLTSASLVWRRSLRRRRRFVERELLV